MIYRNNKELQNLHVGDKEIQRVLLGESLIWENNKIVVLSEGRTWDIRSLYPTLYNTFTLDNFFLLSANRVTGSSSVTVAYEGDVKYLSITGGLSKEYIASTGTLNEYLFNNSNRSNVIPVVVSKPEKLIYCGLGTSFDMKTFFPNSYQSLTVNNFIIKTVRHFNGSGRAYGLICNNSRTFPGNWSATNTETLVKTYNASTGILSCYLNDTGNADGIDRWNSNSNVYLYASEKSFV